MGNHVTCSYFNIKVELTIGNDETMILSKAITILIFIKPSFKFNVNFIVVPQLSEVVIIDNDTLNAMKANIDYDPPRITFKDGNQPVLEETLMHSRVKIHEDPSSSNDLKILQNLNLHASELKFSNNHECNKVIDKLSGNAYLVQNVQDANAPIVTTNVRQMILLHTTESSSVKVHLHSSWRHTVSNIFRIWCSRQMLWTECS